MTDGLVPMPLSGIRVADFCWMIAGPLATRVLANFGAEVIRIESSARTDIIREQGVFPDDISGPNASGVFNDCNTSKLSLSVDIKTPDGIDIVKSVVSVSDIVVNNFRGDQMDKWGLGYEDLVKLKPDIIMISQTMAGQDGPNSRLRAYGPTISSLTGLDSLVGYEGELPLGMGHAYADPNVGLHSTLLALSALEQRRRTGEGAYIDVSMWEAMVTALATPMLDYALNGRVAGPVGDREIPGAPAGVFPCAGEDHWVILEVHDDTDWAGMLKAMEHPEWALDKRFENENGRMTSREELNEQISKWTASRDRDELAELLQSNGVIAAPCLAVSERLFDEHLMAREGFAWVENPTLGREPVYGQAIRLSETPGYVRAPAPMLGQHSAEVLRELLGMSDDEIDELDKAGVLA